MSDPATPDAGPRSAEARRRAVHDLVVAGGVTGPRDLAARLASSGIDAPADALRGDLRALGVVRVEGPDGAVLAVPTADQPGAPSPAAAPGGRFAAVVTSDPDWKLQAVVVAVVVAFLLVALVAYLLGP